MALMRKGHQHSHKFVRISSRGAHDKDTEDLMGRG